MLLGLDLSFFNLIKQPRAVILICAVFIIYNDLGYNTESHSYTYSYIKNEFV